MAADGQVTSQHNAILQTGYRKIVRLEDGRVVGFSGALSLVTKLMRHLEGEEHIFLPESEIEALVLHPDGKVFHHNGTDDPIEQEVPIAVGSGCDFALGAMLAGASPGKAIEIASMRDVYTGGAIIEIAR